MDVLIPFLGISQPLLGIFEQLVKLLIRQLLIFHLVMVGSEENDELQGQKKCFSRYLASLNICARENQAR
jgi:hypothetical protein